MNIVCTIDREYTQHCGVMLCSLFVNNPDASFRVFVITNGLAESDWLKLLRMASPYGHTLEWTTVDPSVIRGARVSGQVSIATYFRILIPRLLPEDVDRTLFLDSDIIVRGSISPLYGADIDEYTHAAIANPLSQGDIARLGLPAASKYFNAGVLLLNLDRWRRERVVDQLLEYISRNPHNLRWWDQDALNATLHGRWRQLRPTWNAQWPFFWGRSCDELEVSLAELAEATTDPRIVHFTGTAKPWHYHMDPHPFKRDYYRYLALTPWKGYTPADRPPLSSRVRAAATRAVPPWLIRQCRRLDAAMRPARSTSRTASGAGRASQTHERPQSSCEALTLDVKGR
jgi:lipopolysaccharide biosynthesis glycosyltransferase